MNKLFRNRQNSGITLIALVITIIVLLILAGVSIAMLTGENGILKQATGAKTKTEKAEAEEQVKLAALAARMRESSGETVTAEDIQKELRETDSTATVTANGNGEYTVVYGGQTYTIDSNYQVIPPFNEEEWKKDETSEEHFEWGSDDPTNAEYNTIRGYKSTIPAGKMKIPVRCKKIENTYSTTYTYGPRQELTKITSVEIPETVTVIGHSAFGGGHFQNLKSIRIPNSVTTIGESAFNGSYIEEITLSNSLTTIGEFAFANCNVKNFIIPSSVTSIGSGAFSSFATETVTIQKTKDSISGAPWGGASSATIIWAE